MHFFLLNSKKCITFAPSTCAGDVCTSSAGVADIFKRRLLALCSDALKCRKFQTDRNIATVDVLRDIDYPSCAYFGMPFAYVYMRTRVP